MGQPGRQAESPRVRSNPIALREEQIEELRKTPTRDKYLSLKQFNISTPKRPAHLAQEVIEQWESVEDENNWYNENPFAIIAASRDPKQNEMSELNGSDVLMGDHGPLLYHDEKGRTFILQVNGKRLYQSGEPTISARGSQCSQQGETTCRPKSSETRSRKPEETECPRKGEWGLVRRDNGI